MKIFYFHLMPYTGLPEDYCGPAWVSCPNELYDPVLGHSLYNEYIDELVYAERVGFDGVVINEHHSTAYGGMPSPNLIGSILARETAKVKIAILGNALPLYNPPTRIAEEWAMIDVISKGRLIAGMVLGGGPEYFSSSINPVFARDIFRETHDLILQCWTRPGPFDFNGNFHKLRYVNPWPMPLQKPHPPIWIPGMGSIETMEFIAARRYSYMGIPYFHKRVVRKNIEQFRQICEQSGYSAAPHQLGWLAPIYVAETDEQAREEFESHFWYFVEHLLPGIDIHPPGYIPARSVPKLTRSMSEFLLNVRTWTDVAEGLFAVVGSPRTVTDILLNELSTTKVGNLLGIFRIGTLPLPLATKSTTLFAEQVAPMLRKELKYSVI